MRAALPWASAAVGVCALAALAPTATWSLIASTLGLAVVAVGAPSSIRQRLTPLVTVCFAIAVVAAVRTFGSPL